MQTGTFRTVCEMERCPKTEEIRAVDFNEYKDQSKEILKEIGVDDDCSDSEADF